MYCIVATILRTYPDGSTSTIQVPTFFLDENVHGIVNKDHAKNIAREIIEADRDIIDLHAEKV